MPRAWVTVALLVSQHPSRWGRCPGWRCKHPGAMLPASPGSACREPLPTVWCGAAGMVLWGKDGNGPRGWWGRGLTSQSLAGGSENSQRVPGHTSSFDIPDLEGGVSYTVKVTALIGNREGNPVSIIVTTRECWVGGSTLGWNRAPLPLTPAPLPHSGGSPAAPRQQLPGDRGLGATPAPGLGAGGWQCRVPPGLAPG